MHWQEVIVVAAASLTVDAGVFAQQSEIAKWDPNFAIKTAVVTNGVKWIDGKHLPIEGRAFDNVKHYYDRLPMGITTNVNRGVINMKYCTSGMLFRFATDSKKLDFKWTPFSSTLSMPICLPPA